jgi:LysR family transcriptional activator of dmlA
MYSSLNVNLRYTMRLKDLEKLRTFLIVYETRSFTRTAERLHVTKTAVAKRLGLFEEELGHKLFRRSTRNITPTQEGEELYLKGKSVLESVEAFEVSLGEKASMKGMIRITCATSMAQRFLADELMKFQEKNPEVLIDLIVTDSILDLVEQNIDLALRINPPKSSILVGKKLGENRLKLVASPKYLKTAPEIRKLQDLKSHPAFYYTQHGDKKFQKNGGKLSEVMADRKFITNDSILISRNILGGKGIGVRSSWDVKEALNKKELIEVLPKEPLEKIGEVWLLSSTGRMQTHRVRELFNHLSSELGRYIE